MKKGYPSSPAALGAGAGQSVSWGRGRERYDLGRGVGALSRGVAL